MKLYIVESAGGLFRCLDDLSTNTCKYEILLIGSATMLDASALSREHNISILNSKIEILNKISQLKRHPNCSLYFCDENFNFRSYYLMKKIQMEIIVKEKCLLTQIERYEVVTRASILKIIARKVKYGIRLKHRRKTNGALVPYFDVKYDKRKIIIGHALKKKFVLPKSVVVVCPLVEVKPSSINREQYKTWCIAFSSAVSKLINNNKDANFLIKFHPRQENSHFFDDLLDYQNCNLLDSGLPLEIYDCRNCVVITLLSSVTITDFQGGGALSAYIGFPDEINNSTNLPQTDLDDLDKQIKNLVNEK